MRYAKRYSYYKVFKENFVYKKMNRKLPPCSLTKIMFTGVADRAISSWIEFPEPLATLSFDYKTAFQGLQMTILEGNPDSLKEIGHCFGELEKQFDKFEKLLKEKSVYTNAL
jgi:hypothetical protein